MSERTVCWWALAGYLVAQVLPAGTFGSDWICGGQATLLSFAGVPLIIDLYLHPPLDSSFTAITWMFTGSLATLLFLIGLYIGFRYSRRAAVILGGSATLAGGSSLVAGWLMPGSYTPLSGSYFWIGSFAWLALGSALAKDRPDRIEAFVKDWPGE